ncbi:lysozyme [Serratia fonticola]|uniref:Lysozyme n=1 Tax=Serratia fonticola TaxID=47917 RepID=A0A542BKK4_SERFO|nr:lysozyme [Serratia fonticola]TQI78997.1 lysozyme [Serratia fonticola]TQI98981.1 lysozyme [Serratia fonticola]TVZ68506.1 lysozyme [Serratia fonticola]
MNSIAKRCSALAILALAMLLPQFDRLNTSEEGLYLIADFEGCQLTPYQCSAGVWTQGVGHTAGVIPGKTITPEQAAENLVDDIRRIEKGMAICLPQEMPQAVYDAVIAFAFNVGTGAACRSTLVYFLQQGQWRQACDQLPRWVYVNGVKNNGLKRRRAAEHKLCQQGLSQASPTIFLGK